MQDKFKGMSRKELVEYIWDYYKLPIIAVVIGIGIVGGLINSIFIHPAPKQYVGVILYGEPVEMESVTRLAALLTDAVVPDELKSGYTAMADNFYDSGNPQVDMAMTQKFAALMMVGEVDILIVNRDEFQAMVGDGVFAPLTEAQAAAFAGLLVDGPDGAAYGVELMGAVGLAACGIAFESPVAGLAVSSKQPEAAARALEVLVRGHASVFTNNTP